MWKNVVTKQFKHIIQCTIKRNSGRDSEKDPVNLEKFLQVKGKAENSMMV